MQKTIVILLFMTSLLTAAGVYAAQDFYYVQSIKAKVLAGPSFKSRIIGEASKGTKFVSRGREGSWVKVVFYQNEGYVSSLLLSKYPPMNKLSVIKGDEVDIKRSVRRRASTYTSAAAARGLTQDDRRRLSRDEKADYSGLDKMESFTISPEEVARFMEGSKL